MRLSTRGTGPALALGACLGGAPAVADEVILKGGGRLEGIVVERTEAAVVVETGPGRVTVAASRVLRIVESRSGLEVYRERAASLDPLDAAGWAALARWAEERRLETQAREAWRRVLDVSPSHPEANAALGRVEVDGAWMPEDDAWRARGYVRFEDRWVTPAEHEALVRARLADEAARLREREADGRVREAEARAREAEARAREAEAAAQVDEGIPFWWGWGSGIALPPVGHWPSQAHPGPRPHPRRQPPSSPAVEPGPAPPAPAPPPRPARRAGVSRPAPTPAER